MKVFISQSGPRSLAIATDLQAFVRRLVPDAEPWLSPTGIAKGTRWGVELATSLKDAGAGLICLTLDNLTAPWILFEAGALSREPSNRVWTFHLDDIEEGQVGPQLAQFQNTKPTRNDILLMIRSMNDAIAAKPRGEDDLLYLFGLLWPPLETRIAEIRAMPREAAPAPRPSHEIMEEILGAVRGIGRQSDDDSWRIVKTLAMLSQMYRQLFNSKAPSMKELNALQRAHAAMEGLLEPTNEPGVTGQPQYSDTPLPLREATIRSADETPKAELKTEHVKKE